MDVKQNYYVSREIGVMFMDIVVIDSISILIVIVKSTRLIFCNILKKSEYILKCQKYIKKTLSIERVFHVRVEGFEPSTIALKGRCSTC